MIEKSNERLYQANQDKKLICIFIHILSKCWRTITILVEFNDFNEHTALQMAIKVTICNKNIILHN